MKYLKNVNLDNEVVYDDYPIVYYSYESDNVFLLGARPTIWYYNDGTIYKEDIIGTIDSNKGHGSDGIHPSSSITKVEIGANVTKIDYGAFERCWNLTSITIPDSVTSIGDIAFAFTKITSITTPENLTVINPGMCSACTSLNSVIINDNVTNIGYSAFAYCTSLTSVTIPDSVTSIGYRAFSKTGPLTIYFTGTETQWEAITKVSTWAQDTTYTVLYVSKNKTKVTYKDGTTAQLVIIGTVTKSNIPNIDNVIKIELGNDVTSIDEDAFRNCYSLTSVIIPDSVTSIGSCAFASCSGLTSVIIPDSVTSIGSNAFASCNELTSVIIPDSVTSIGVGAFAQCSGLTSVIISNRVTNIQDGTFTQCVNLTSVIIPDSVTKIGNYPFANCTSLTSVTIPDSVTSIGGGAFASCTKLVSIYCPSISEPCEVNGGTFSLNSELGGILHVKKGGSTETYPTWMNDQGNLGWSGCGTWIVQDDL